MTRSTQRKLRLVQAWLRRRGFQVQSAPQGQWNKDFTDFESRCVWYNSRSLPLVQVYTLLHEAGHILIWMSRRRRPKRAFLGRSLRQTAAPARTKHQRLNVLHEEIEAWSRGWRLGQRLRLGLVQSKYEEDRTASLMTYVRWMA